MNKRKDKKKLRGKGIFVRFQFYNHFYSPHYNINDILYLTC